MCIGLITYRWQIFRHPRIFRNRKLPNPIERAISLWTQIIIGLVTYVIMVGFAPFRCFRQQDGSFSLIPSSNLNCYDEEWFSHLFIIGLGLLHILIIPFGLIMVFKANRERLFDNSFLWKFGKLTEPYVDETYWWEVVVLLNKILFVMTVDLTSSFDPNLRVFLVEILLLVMVLVEQLFQPRKPSQRMNYFVYVFETAFLLTSH
jgi:hypothetical protein